MSFPPCGKFPLILNLLEKKRVDRAALVIHENMPLPFIGVFHVTTMDQHAEHSFEVAFARPFMVYWLSDSGVFYWCSVWATAEHLKKEHIQKEKEQRFELHPKPFRSIGSSLHICKWAFPRFGSVVHSAAC